jgi:hypothetical protein
MLSVLDSPMFSRVGQIILCHSIVASQIVLEFFAIEPVNISESAQKTDAYNERRDPRRTRRSRR